MTRAKAITASIVLGFALAGTVVDAAFDFYQHIERIEAHLRHNDARLDAADMEAK